MLKQLTEKQEQARLDAILGLCEGCLKVLWGHVVERGRGLNFKVHGKHTSWQGPMETIREMI